MANKFLRWTSIRALGELQILTRASYILLITVPLIAALWPGVKIIINQYNISINNAIEVLHHSSQQLQLESERLEKNLSNDKQENNNINLSNKIAEITNPIEPTINKLKDEITNSSIKNNLLPDTLAFLFFASLFIFVAHLLYQAFAPELIKERNTDDYIRTKKEEYSQNPTERSLEIAQSRIKFLKYMRGVRDKPRSENFDHNKDYEENLKRWELEVIETAAQLLYIHEAERNLIAIFFSGFLYLIGIILILVVINEQSWSVAKAAGWVS